ncbi:MAG: DHH family phosphoesterase [Oscillospiraceae bacterium]|nr:DHH family phosphoesterase [Oscillospiraceae bacterium]
MKPRYHIGVWILMAVLLIAVLVPGWLLYQRGDRYGWLYSMPAAVLTLAAAGVMLYSQIVGIRYAARLGDECDRAELETMRRLPMGICVLNDKGMLVQNNICFRDEIMEGVDLFGRSLPEILPFNLHALEQDVCTDHRWFHVTSLPYQTDDGSRLTAFLWEDVTELEGLRTAYTNSRPCVMLLVVDNYEDLIQNAKESVRLEVSVAVERLLEDFVAGTGGILRRLKNDRFFAVLEEQHVQELMNGKFKILDEARAISVDDKNCVTFSIGVGHGASSLQESEAFAAQCLDMALGRGGDQAAVKTDSGFRFFGGVSKGVEKKSRAKTRIVAGAIQELIDGSDQVFIMGHRFGDLDSIGGACGLAGAIRLMGVPVNVVCDPDKNLSHQLIDLVEEEVGDELFLTPEQAIDSITNETLLIINDTHNKDIIESPELYHKARRVVVIDHHRKNVNFVDNAVVFHHEPYASSACEMITELIQYFKLPEPIDSVYADCLLSGITLDTKNFIVRTGVRTFEAAAYLRKIGADTIRVRALFSGSIEAYRSRTEIVGSAVLHGSHAVAVAPDEMPDIRIVAPQAADELLGISHVDAAYVIYKVGNVVNISARSYGAVNVQVIMEQLGGGGHQTMAATQITGITSEEARERLLAVIGEMTEAT